jgi:NAD(P)-dependent dehydrogenase (short-subunit alcohol dehydrogenase family)
MFAPGLFADQVIVVTGGGSGIGLATAREAASLGATVAVCGRSAEKLAAAEAAFLDDGLPPSRFFSQPCDIRDPESVARFVEAVLARFARIDVLVNNAGGQFPSPAEMMSPKGWEAVIRNNLNGTFYMTREVATRAMIPARRGRIVMVTAMVARGFPGMAHTGAARAGVENMTKSLAVEWAQFDVRVNAVAPGIIQSSGIAQYPPELIAAGVARTPQKRIGTVEEVAHAIVYLASPAAAFVTGTTLQIDGGASLWGDTWLIPERESGGK